MQNTAQVIPFAPIDDNDVVEGLLVSLKVRQWKGRKKDDKVTGKVASDNSVNSDVGAYHKRLFDKCALGEIAADISKAREEQYRLTMPWSDGGLRLLPMGNFDEYTNTMAALKNKIERAVTVFLDHYDVHVSDAQQILGKLFNATDYPPVSEVADKFSFDISYCEIPTGDLRVSMSDETRRDLEASIRKDTQQRIYDAVEDRATRIADQLRHYRDNICGEKVNESGKVSTFKPSSLAKVGREISIIKAVNLTNDPRLNAVCDVVEELADEIKARDSNGNSLHESHIRNSPTFRKSQAQKADDVLKKMGWA